MREIRLSGSEGGGTPVLPTPIVKSFFPIWLKPSPTLKSCPDAKHQSRDSGKTRAFRRFEIYRSTQD
jgi:hypothetical protein